MNKYFKNFILCGDIEHYCLLCQELFKEISDVEKHIRWEKHRKSLKNQIYFPKFRRDFIYKVANQFYCEICNVVHANVGTITDHINKDEHKAMKNNLQTETKNFVGRYDCGYIVLNRVIINMAQWNSIVDKRCLLCDISVQNITEHTALEAHIIKLIQSETIYEEERYYRKINDDKYHCFTCKKVYSSQNFNNHWPKCENIDEIEIQKLQEVGSSKSLKTSTVEDIIKMADLEKQLIGTLQEFYVIDEKKNLASCKYCSTTVAINFKSMIEHMKNQHDNQDSNATPKEKPKAQGNDNKLELGQASDHKADDCNKPSKECERFLDHVDHGKLRSELAKYGREHSIKLNYNGSKGWCFVCDRNIPAHMKNFREHIQGAHHKANLDPEGVKNSEKFVPKEYKTKSVLQCNIKYAPQEKEFLINDTYSVDVYSFFLLYQIKNDPHFKKTKCYACNELFPQGQEYSHCETAKHINNFVAAKFMQTKDSAELFTREIRPHFYHCGFCNLTFPSMDLLYPHVMSLNHLILQDQKTDALWPAIKINTKADDAYKKLLYCAFRHN